MKMTDGSVISEQELAVVSEEESCRQQE